MARVTPTMTRHKHTTAGEPDTDYRVVTKHGSIVVCDAGTLEELSEELEKVRSSYVLYHDDNKSYTGHYQTLSEAREAMSQRSYDMFPHENWWRVEKDDEIVWPSRNLEDLPKVGQESLGDYL